MCFTAGHLRMENAHRIQVHCSTHHKLCHYLVGGKTRKMDAIGCAFISNVHDNKYIFVKNILSKKLCQKLVQFF